MLAVFIIKVHLRLLMSKVFANQVIQYVICLSLFLDERVDVLQISKRCISFRAHVSIFLAISELARRSDRYLTSLSLAAILWIETVSVSFI